MGDRHAGRGYGRVQRQNLAGCAGHPHSESLRVEERFHRLDFGHMDIQAAVDDPVMLTNSVTVKFTVLLLPNSDVLENFCMDGERDQLYTHGAAK